MNLLGLWVIIFSAIVLAHALVAACGQLIVASKWYRKWINKVSWNYVEDSLKRMDKKEDEGLN